ncbi:MAG: tol-pal system-associated acyl-CoA thioesterase [Lysobacterales bacterium]
MTALAERFVWPVRVYWEDTDAGGVVYHGSYLRFLERARSEWLRALGLDQSRLKDERDLVFVVSQLSLSFRRPARLDDQLLVESSLLRRGGASLHFDQAISRGAGAELLLEAKVRVACVSASGFRPRPIPADLFVS